MSLPIRRMPTLQNDSSLTDKFGLEQPMPILSID